MNSSPVPPPRPDYRQRVERSQWLSDLGVALDRADRLTADLAGDPQAAVEVAALRARIALVRATLALVRAGRKLRKQGYGLLIHDGYRPWRVTKAFWDATPTEKHIFVANPATGSKHNRGCAIDLSLYDLKSGLVNGYRLLVQTGTDQDRVTRRGRCYCRANGGVLGGRALLSVIVDAANRCEC